MTHQHLPFSHLSFLNLKRLLTTAVVLGVGVAVCMVARTAVAQSGSRSYSQPQQQRQSQPQYSQPGSSSRPAYNGGSANKGSGTTGSSNRFAAPMGSDTKSAPLAMRGYCPVCLVNLKQWVAGKPAYTAVYDGKAYRFPAADQLQVFNANPTAYLPVLNGDDIVDYAQSGRRVPGNLAYGLVHQGRMYFFASEANKQTFSRDPRPFANADLALGGDCVVCQVNMNQRMPGTADLTIVQDGLRYQFAGLQQMNAFKAAPQQFTGAASQRTAGSTTRPGTAPAGSGGRPAGSSPYGGSGSSSR